MINRLDFYTGVCVICATVYSVGDMFKAAMFFVILGLVCGILADRDYKNKD